MIKPSIPPDEEKRLGLLKACRVLYTEAEETYDDVARLAADLCGTEIALITLVDADYQWFKARVGVEQTGVPRDLSFCGHCINRNHPLVVEDTLLDPRFSDNPLVTGDPFIRFYAGVPLLMGEGSSIGALSVADRAPRSITVRQLDALRRLAQQVTRELSLRRDLERATGASSPPPDFPIAPGAMVGGRWSVGRELGRGNVGVVFEAKGPAGDRAAIKVLLPEWRRREDVLERFVREAKVLMRITSPHVGRLLDVGNLDAASGGLPYLVLEYLEGADLGKLVDDNGPLPFRQAFSWCADACEGVAEAHDLGVVHRDLKPSNVFLAETGASPVVKVLDFGIAAGDPTAEQPIKLTDAGALVGSPAYMAPEQMMGREIDKRTDVWSMGALLYELVTGQVPFPGPSALAVFANAMTKPPLPLKAHVKGLPPGVEDVILTCLRKQPEDRYDSMRELADALRVAAVG